MGSLIVVSDDHGLVHRGLSDAFYRMQTSPFVKRLLNVIAYEQCNPLLSDLPNILHQRYATSKSFEARFHARCSEGRPCLLTLRDFFELPIDPMSEFSVVDGDFAASLILPPLPRAGPIFDDIAARADCVRVREYSPGMVEIASYGMLAEPGGLQGESKVLTEVRSRTKASDPGDWAPPPLVDLVNAVLADDEVTKLPKAAITKNWEEEVRKIGSLFMEVTECRKTEIFDLYPILPYWPNLGLEAWRSVINRAVATVQGGSSSE
jgi:hypothetical protein